MNYYSQSNQDFIIDYFFEGKSNGTFIDIGAHNGVTMSNSYFFEKERNWKGICVEPIPEVFKELKENRSCHLVNGAISGVDEVLEFRRNHGRTEMLSGIIKYRDKRHDKKTEREIETFGGSSEVIKVQGYVLSNLLEEYDMKDIDYLSLDIEGGEFEVLETIDFEKYNIRYLTIENNYNEKNIRSLMKEKGYDFFLHHHKDDFYVKEEYANKLFYLKNWRMFRLWSWGKFLLFFKFFVRP